MRPIVINVVAGEGKSWARTIWFWFVSTSITCCLFIIRMWRRARSLKQLTPGKPRRFRESELVFGMIEFKPIDGQTMIAPKKPIEVKDVDGRYYAEKNPFLIESADQTPIRIRDKNKVEIEIQKIEADGKQIWARVASAKANSKKLRRTKRQMWSTASIATICTMLLVLMQRWQPATRFVQLLIDTSPFI